MSAGYRSTPYARGFRFGQRKAWADRVAGCQAPPRPADEDLPGEFDRGFWDGYTPRDPRWFAPINDRAPAGVRSNLEGNATMPLGRPATTRPAVLAAIVNAGRAGITNADICAACGCTAKVAKQVIGRLRDMGEPIHTVKVDEVSRYVHDPEAGAPARRMHSNTAADVVLRVVTEAGARGMSGKELIAIVGKDAAEWGAAQCVRRKLIVSRKWIGSARAGWRYFLTAEMLEAAFAVALAERDAKRAAARRPKQTKQKAPKVKVERKKPQPLKHQRMTIAQPAPRPATPTRWTGEADFSRATVTRCPPVVDRRHEVQKAERYFAGLTPGSYPPGRAWSALVTGGA